MFQTCLFVVLFFYLLKYDYSQNIQYKAKDEQFKQILKQINNYIKNTSKKIFDIIFL